MYGSFGRLDYDNKRQHCITCDEYKCYSDFYASDRGKHRRKCRACRETQASERLMAKFNGNNAAAAAHIAKHVSTDVYKRMAQDKQIKLRNKLAYQIAYEEKTIEGYQSARAAVERMLRKLI